MSKTPASKASTKKAAAKAPAAKTKPSAKAAPAKKMTAAKAPAKTPVKAAPKPAAKAPAKSAPVVAKAPAAKAAPVKAAPPARPAPAPQAPVSAAPPPARSSRSGRTPPPEPVAAPLPPATSRFADRFAPPRPPTRQMNNLALDTPKPMHKADPKLANAWKAKAGRDLSEAELLAMPDSEYMNDKQLEFFRNKLQTLKDDLLSNAGETTEHLREDTSIVPDPADRATIEEEHALELRTRDRERKLIKKIDESLRALENNEYGYCEVCGIEIGIRRLEARPTANLCIDCKTLDEIRERQVKG